MKNLKIKNLDEKDIQNLKEIKTIELEEMKLQDLKILKVKIEIAIKNIEKGECTEFCVNSKYNIWYRMVVLSSCF